VAAPNPFDFMPGQLRSILGMTERSEQEIIRHSPLAETRELELRLAETVAVVARSAESLERQIAVLGTLAEALPPLTEAVTRLSVQLGALLEIAAPLEAAERDVSRLEHRFGHHHSAEPSREGAPVEAAERPHEGAQIEAAERPREGAPAEPAERDVRRYERLFGRRRSVEPPRDDDPGAGA
jgi:hypothetical protein